MADNAFNPPVDSMGALLTQPLFEENRRVRLKWRQDIHDTPIFPLGDRQFSDIWLRTTLVAGYPERIRPYSLRVGAGNRLDGIYSCSFI